MSGQDALATVFIRNAFYKRLYYLALGILALSIVVIVVLLFMISYLAKYSSPPVYFATDEIGRLLPITPVEVPNMKTEDVATWATTAVEAAYSYDYVNYRAQLQNAEKYFTAYGWRNYMNALQSSNNLVALRENKMIIIAKAVARPELLTEGLLSGAYAWRFKIPLLVTYSRPPFDGTVQFSNALEVTLIVQRQPVLQSYQGLGVLQMIGTFAAAPTNNAPATISNVPTG